MAWISRSVSRRRAASRVASAESRNATAQAMTMRTATTMVRTAGMLRPWLEDKYGLVEITIKARIRNGPYNKAVMHLLRRATNRRSRQSARVFRRSPKRWLKF